MIQFNFTGEPYPSLQKQEEDKQWFIDELGDLKDEFEQKGGVVTFDYSYPPDDNRHISFNIDGGRGDLGDFIHRWNQLRRERHTPLE